MVHRTVDRPLRFTTLAAAATAAVAGAGALTLRVAAIVPTGGGLTSVDEVVELGVVAIGAAAAWWLAVGLVVACGCATTRGLGRRWVAGERFVQRHAPAVVRRGLALTIGAGFGIGAAVVPAVGQSADPPADLGWVATQVAAAPASVVAGPPPAAGGTGTAASTASTASTAITDQVTVLPGDSLWAIAAEHLPAGATDADIAVAWPTWYEANRAVVGDDPHQIRPGQVLSRPAPAPATGTATSTGTGTGMATATATGSGS